MPNKGRNKKAKRAGAAKKTKANAASTGTTPTTPTAPATPDATQTPGADVQEDEASKRFAADLQVRGEAAPLDEEGNLPLEATHIIKKKPDGTTEIKRARFKMF